jgi:catechol 2,3-dioxygenase-like lactoylglutathione lyase family enzyme
MRLLHLTLPVSDVGAVASYFHDVLQQRVVGNHVHIGWSTIELQPAEGRPVGGVHLAFNVPDNRFGEAMTWLRERTPLQRNPAGWTTSRWKAAGSRSRCTSPAPMA